MLRLLLFFLLTTSAGLLVLTLGLAYRAAGNYVRPHRQPVLRTPASVGFEHFQDVRLPLRDGRHMVAWYTPSRSGAALILVHGLGGNREHHLELARDLASLGYGTFMPDLRAHGDSDADVSTLGVREASDMASAVAWLRLQPDVDPERLGIYGSSLGAATALLAAAELTALRAVVADSSFASIDWVVQNQLEPFVRLPRFLGPLISTLGSLQAGVQASTIAPVNVVGQIAPRPLLLIHGTADETFRLDNTQLLAAAAGEPTETWILPGVGHAGGYSVNPLVYREKLAEFYGRAL